MADDPGSGDDWFTEYMRPAYARIGEVACNWSALEATIDEAIRLVAGISDDVGACLTSNIQSARYKAFSLQALLDLKGYSDFANRVGRLSKDVDNLSRKRNRIVHDPVFIRRENGKTFRIRKFSTAERKLIQGSEPIVDSDWKIVANDIAKLDGEFLILLLDLNSKIAQVHSPKALMAYSKCVGKSVFANDA